MRRLRREEWMGTESPQRSYNKEGNLREKPQMLATVKGDRDEEKMREAITEEEANGFIAQTVEPNRSMVTPPRKQEILKLCAPKNKIAKCVQQTLIELKGKVDKFLRTRTRHGCPLLTTFVIQYNVGSSCQCSK